MRRVLTRTLRLHTRTPSMDTPLRPRLIMPTDSLKTGICILTMLLTIKTSTRITPVWRSSTAGPPPMAWATPKTRQLTSPQPIILHSKRRVLTLLQQLLSTMPELVSLPQVEMVIDYFRVYASRICNLRSNSVKIMMLMLMISVSSRHVY